MPTRSRVAVLKVKPQTVLTDIERLCELAGMKQALDRTSPTILKDNISWHYPFPAANTTPWQLEGTILALRRSGFKDLTCVQNKTVVTDAFKGEDLNHYKPIFRAHDIPVLFTDRGRDFASGADDRQILLFSLDPAFVGKRADLLTNDPLNRSDFTTYNVDLIFGAVAETDVGATRFRAMYGRFMVWQAMSPMAPVPKSHQPRQLKSW